MIRSVLTYLLLLSSLAVAQVKRPFTFEDMMALKRVSEPVVSPDGKWVAFSAVDVNLEKNTKTPHLWVVPANGGDCKAADFRPGRRSAALVARWQEAGVRLRPRWHAAGLGVGFRSDDGEFAWRAGEDHVAFDWSAMEKSGRRTARPSCLHRRCFPNARTTPATKRKRKRRQNCRKRRYGRTCFTAIGRHTTWASARTCS